MVRQLPVSSLAEDALNGFVNFGFEIVSVQQISTTRQLPAEEKTRVSTPLFLITLPRTSKSREIFKLTSLCHIAIKIEAYKAQTGLAQCNNS
jgi:hypothetical protein